VQGGPIIVRPEALEKNDMHWQLQLDKKAEFGITTTTIATTNNDDDDPTATKQHLHVATDDDDNPTVTIDDPHHTYTGPTMHLGLLVCFFSLIFFCALLIIIHIDYVGVNDNDEATTTTVAHNDDERGSRRRCVLSHW
jgi:hypothetical protein